MTGTRGQRIYFLGPVGGVCDIAKIEKLLAFIRGYDALQAPQGAA